MHADIHACTKPVKVPGLIIVRTGHGLNEQ